MGGGSIRDRTRIIPAPASHPAPPYPDILRGFVRDTRDAPDCLVQFREMMGPQPYQHQGYRQPDYGIQKEYERPGLV